MNGSRTTPVAPIPGPWNGSSGQGMCYDHTKAMNATEMACQVRDMMNQSRNDGMFGSMTCNGSHYGGNFVAYDIDRNGVIANYSINNTGQTEKVFDSVDCLGTAAGNITQIGSVMEARNGSIDITVHDNPTAMMKCVLNGTDQTVNFTCNGTWSVSYCNQSGPHGCVAMLTMGTTTGMVLVDNGTLSVQHINGRTVITASATKGKVIFLTSHPGPDHLVEENQIVQGIASGKVVGQLSFVTNHGSAVSEEQEYTDCSMSISSIHDGHASVNVSSASSDAKVVELMVDKKGQNCTTDGVTASLNGAKMTKTTLDQVLAMNGTDNASASYVVIDEGSSWTVLAYLPHLSAQVLTLHFGTEANATSDQGAGTVPVVNSDLLSSAAMVSVVIIGVVVVVEFVMLRRGRK